jgi:hypothetical protein
MCYIINCSCLEEFTYFTWNCTWIVLYYNLLVLKSLRIVFQIIHEMRCIILALVLKNLHIVLQIIHEMRYITTCSFLEDFMYFASNYAWNVLYYTCSCLEGTTLTHLRSISVTSVTVSAIAYEFITNTIVFIIIIITSTTITTTTTTTIIIIVILSLQIIWSPYVFGFRNTDCFDQ